jgi:hypothetical protein
MHFLNASLLWPVLPLVGVPLLIHWLNRRFPKKFLFSSIEEIRRTMAGRSRVFRWRHLLMLALRTLALAALLAAFLKPVVTRRAPATGETRNVILMVDHSLSMAHNEGGSTARARAAAEARRLLDSLDADFRFNLIRVDHAPAAAFTGFSTNKAAALEFLENSPPPLTHADIRAANRLAATIAAEAAGPLDVYYFSDFQRRNWADVDFHSLPSGARLFFVSATSDPRRANRSIAALDLGPGAVIAGGEAQVRARVANHSPEPWTGTMQAGFGPAHMRERELTLAPWAEADVTLPVPVPAGGLLRLTAALPPDALPADDTRHLVVRVRDREEVVILTGGGIPEGIPAPSLFLTTAVNPFDGERGIYQSKQLEPAALTPAALATSSRVIATRLPALTDEQAATLATFLRAGGGAILFLDGDADAGNLEKLATHAGDAMPLALTRRLDSTHLPGGAMRVASGDFRSRFLRLFDGERRQNLALLEFYDLHHAAHTGAGTILLSYADGTPALAETTIGLGTLLICNFSVAEASSNMARQRLFPAWIHEMLLQMSHTGTAAMEPFRVGDTITGETWTAEGIGRELTGPDGSPVRARTDPSGERIRITFTATRPGFHRLTGGDGQDLLAFAVNPDADQSDLRTIDPGVLPDRAGGTHADAAHVGASGNYHHLLRGRPAFHWFVLAALAFLMIEGVLFKPRAAGTA